MMGGGMMGLGMGGGGIGLGAGLGGGILGGLLMLLFWGGLIVAAVVGARWLWDRGRPVTGGGREASSLEILKQRYARGEIGREEFEMKRRDLQ